MDSKSRSTATNLYVLLLKCKVCPDFLNPRTISSTSCDCQEKYLDKTQKKCVNFFDCPVFDIAPSFLDSIPDINVEQLNTVTEKLVETLLSGEREDFVQQMANLFSILPLDGVVEMADSKDLQLLQKVFKDNLGDVYDKYSTQVSIIANPFVMRNVKINKICQGNTVCVFARVLTKDEKLLSKLITDMVTEVADALMAAIEDLEKEQKAVCKRKECRFVKAVVIYKGFAKEVLNNSKPFSGVIADNVISMLMLLGMQRTNLDGANK